MTDNVLTPEFRAAFVGLFKATAPKDNPNGAKKFSLRAVFDPSTDISELKRQALIAAQEKWGANIPKNLRSPFRTNEELDNPIPGVPDDATVMTFSAAEDKRPGLVDHNCADIIDDAVVYSGAYFRAQVRAYGYDQAGNKGIAFGLQNVQKLRDGEPLGSGRMPASKAFDAVPQAGEKTASALFD